MKAGHRLQQEHRDKSSLFSPSEFAEPANWICCLLFCFRWAVVFPWKMPLFNLQVWTALSPDYHHWFLNSYSTVGQPCSSYICISSWLFYLHSAVLPHWCASGLRVTCVCPEQEPVTAGNPFCWKRAAGKLLGTSQSCCWAVQAAQNRSHNQLSSSSDLFVLLAVLCTH